MKKVYQTIVDKGNGNCMQAVVASLFELELNEVPHFLNFGDSWWKEFDHFFRTKGLDPCYIHRNKNHDTTESMINIAKFDGGINGYFYGAVKSQTFEGVIHAVIIDSDLNIVHDPNPNQKALSLTPDDVEGFYVTKEMIIGKTGKCFTHEDWDNASEEERDANTYKVGE